MHTVAQTKSRDRFGMDLCTVLTNLLASDGRQLFGPLRASAPQADSAELIALEACSAPIVAQQVIFDQTHLLSRQRWCWWE
eukprot:4922671-Amphidinium_carterae.1